MAAAVAAVVVLSGCTARELPAGPTEADVAKYYEAVADAHWAGLGLGAGVERPETPSIQFSTQEDWAASVARCMNDAGFDFYSAQGGALTVTGDLSGPTDTVEEKVAGYVCQLSYQPEAVDGQILSRAQLDYVYDYYLRFLIPCLGSRGERVADIPDRASFVAESGIGPWNPYWAVMTDSQDAFEESRAQCPPMPPGLATPWE